MGKSTKQIKEKISSSGICEYLKNAGKTILLLILLPPMLNYGGLKKEREYFQSNAILFDIGFDQQLYMNCTGVGTPTVILDAPTGSSSDVWLHLQKELSSISTVCVYDRAGLGLSDVPRQLNGSDPGEGAVLRTLGPESTVVRMVSDLHRLVTFATPRQRPFLLVGAELGGAVVQTYSHLHPQDVAGLILINPLHSSLLHIPAENTGKQYGVKQDGVESPWLNYWFNHLILSYRLLQISAMLGLNRLGLLTGQLNLPNISDDEDVIARQKHQICDPFHVQAVIDEYRSIGTSLNQVDEISNKWILPTNISVSVISGSMVESGLEPEMTGIWEKSLQNLVNSLPGSEFIDLSSRQSSMYSSKALEDEIKKTLEKIQQKI